MNNKNNTATSWWFPKETVVDATAIIRAMKKGYFQRRLAGMILVDTLTARALAIEFYGPRDDGVEVEYIACDSALAAQQFFVPGTPDALIEQHALPPAHFETLEYFIRQHATSMGRKDVKSGGCEIYHCFLP